MPDTDSTSSGTAEPPDRQLDGGGAERWLRDYEVQKLWPVRGDKVFSAASRAGVRYRVVQGRSRGTYGADPTYHLFHPGDVRQAATAMAEGRVDLPPLWRTDTPEGQRAERWSRFRFNATCLVILLVAAGLLGLAVYGIWVS